MNPSTSHHKRPFAYKCLNQKPQVEFICPGHKLSRFIYVWAEVSVSPCTYTLSLITLDTLDTLGTLDTLDTLDTWHLTFAAWHLTLET